MADRLAEQRAKHRHTQQLTEHQILTDYLKPPTPPTSRSGGKLDYAGNPVPETVSGQASSQSQMSGSNSGKVTADKVAQDPKFDRTMHEVDLMGQSDIRQQILTSTSNIPSNLRAEHKFSQEGYIASELQSKRSNPLDSVPMPCASNQYELDKLVENKDSTNPGFMERVGYIQKFDLNFTKETPDARIQAKVGDYGKTSVLELSDDDFGDLVKKI